MQECIKARKQAFGARSYQGYHSLRTETRVTLFSIHISSVLVWRLCKRQIGASHHSLEVRLSTFITWPPIRSVREQPRTQQRDRSDLVSSLHTASHDSAVLELLSLYLSPEVPLMFRTQWWVLWEGAGADIIET